MAGKSSRPSPSPSLAGLSDDLLLECLKRLTLRQRCVLQGCLIDACVCRLQLPPTPDRRPLAAARPSARLIPLPLPRCCRLRSAAGVCRRWYDLCMGPELAQNLQLSAVAGTTDEWQPLAEWLAASAMPRARRVRLQMLGPYGEPMFEVLDEDEQRRLEEEKVLLEELPECLATLFAAACGNGRLSDLHLQLNQVGGLTLGSWVLAARSSLRRLHVQMGSCGLQLAAPLHRLTALQELWLFTDGQLLLERGCTLPPSATKLVLGGSRRWVDSPLPQVGG